jgi:Spy/CpxP family protein refolding chaperone
MKFTVLKTAMSAILLAALAGFAAPGMAQDKSTNSLESIHEKFKADKKLIVAKYLELTESEAKKFWPVYEEYQKDLQKLNERLRSLLESYATEYQSNSLSDDKAKKLLDEWIALDRDEASHRKTYAAKVLKVLPAKKAARYLQIENEARVIVKYDLAATVPLVE